MKRRHVHGTTYVDERAISLEGDGASSTLDTYHYLLPELYTVTGLVKKNGTLAEAYVYDTYGKVTLWGYRNFDFDRDGDVEKAENAYLVGLINAGQPTSDPMADGDMDGDVDINDSNMVVTTSTGAPPITLLTSGVGNQYHFTGAKLTLYEDYTLGGVSPNLQAQFNRARHYDPALGRWLQRDPLEYVDGMSLYEYVRSNPALMTDLLGLWGTDVHRDKTTTWAGSVFYPRAAAEAIGAATHAVDGGWTSPAPWVGNQSYHFDRPFGGPDSRLVHNLEHLWKAEQLCDWSKQNDDPSAAVKQLGLALHPIQDWVAHGDHGKSDTRGAIWTIHNSLSPQTNFGDPGNYPDDPELDAPMGPDGRPAGPAVFVRSRIVGISPFGLGFRREDYDFAIYMPGRRRILLTEYLTRRDLTSFRLFVRIHGKPCGRCRDYFGLD